MLNEIRVQNLGVIEDACLNPSNRITIITGETGAGKSIVLGALGLLLGKRADPSLVRAGATASVVEGIWDISKLQEIKERLKDIGAILEDDEIFINRTISKDGKSRLIVGGKTTPIAVLSQFGEELVTVHGQSDQMRLKNPVIHREMLDKFGGDELGKTLEAYQDIYNRWKRLNTHIKEIKTNAVVRERELDEIMRAIEEISKWEPQEGEDEQLLSEITVLANVEELQGAIGRAYTLLSNNSDDQPDISRLMSLVLSEIENVNELDPKAKVFHDQLLGLYTELLEITGSMNSYLDTVDIDALQRLQEAQDRLSALNSLKRRYGPELADVIKFLEEAQQKLEELNPEANDLEVLEAELLTLSKDLRTEGTNLTNLRLSAAKRLEAAVNNELLGLAMRGNDLVVQVSPIEKYSIIGKEEIEFLMRTPGNPSPRPIHKSASGGELSRIMLALALVLRDNTVPTIVFDEIDSGVSGITAQEIGKKIANLSTSTQVLQVTHLPQIAIYADTHYVIEKDMVDGKPLTTVRLVEGEERVKEIARMLAGDNTSQSALTHATELLEEAKKFKDTL